LICRLAGWAVWTSFFDREEHEAHEEDGKAERRKQDRHFVTFVCFVGSPA
jgi:hypothetical protein